MMYAIVTKVRKKTRRGWGEWALCTFAVKDTVTEAKAELAAERKDDIAFGGTETQYRTLIHKLGRGTKQL